MYIFPEDLVRVAEQEFYIEFMYKLYIPRGLYQGCGTRVLEFVHILYIPRGLCQGWGTRVLEFMYIFPEDCIRGAEQEF